MVQGKSNFLLARTRQISDRETKEGARTGLEPDAIRTPDPTPVIAKLTPYSAHTRLSLPNSSLIFQSNVPKGFHGAPSSEMVRRACAGHLSRNRHSSGFEPEAINASNPAPVIAKLTPPPSPAPPFPVGLSEGRRMSAGVGRGGPSLGPEMGGGAAGLAGVSDRHSTCQSTANQVQFKGGGGRLGPGGSDRPPSNLQ